ncbi:serine/threonine-protein kinase [Haloplanus halophilus]|uniref:serine/threonine-protein kinase n=1 Tax=Haloplanus halophilus TaxID=2949993 RepID=UPI00203DD835|nr:serine/threonine-protein kinase [Haloplanus sp. GDY1]
MQTSPPVTNAVETVVAAAVPADAPLQVARVGPDPRTVLLYAILIGVLSLGLGFGVGAYRTRRRSEGAAPDEQSTSASNAGAAQDAAEGGPSGTRGGPETGDPSRPPHEPTGREGKPTATGEGRPPDRIPRAPDVSVDYADLTDERPIGGGGNADVTLATLPARTGDVPLAIKKPRLSGTLHADAVDRLLREAETWDKLDDHDHVVGVVDYGAEPLPWIAMEYMDGGHLGERAGRLGTAQALWTALAVTTGVRHAHRRGVAHLDLKPENVLFRSVDGAWDVPKVADWGLSKHLLDRPESVDGLSPHYAAPEQFDDAYGPTDDLTDVYQLGAVFYDLFTGRPPFEGDSTAVMRAVLDDSPPPPSAVADVPEALDDVVMTALAKDRDDRYDDIVYLRDDLQDLYDGM